MYLKVYYNPNKQDAQVDEVRAMLPADMPGFTVDRIPGSCVAVNFPQGSKYSDFQRVQKVLQDAGFETE